MTFAPLVLVFASATAPVSLAAPADQEKSHLTARVSRWQGDPAKKRKGPKGFDLQLVLVGTRFDGTFGVEGVPQNVPEGEPFDVQIKLTNVGKKSIKIASVSVTGDGVSLATELVTPKIEAKSAASVATFKVPAQSSAGSSFLITVVQANGDKHTATLTFSRVS